MRQDLEGLAAHFAASRMNDEELVRFAAACSAVAVSRFPLPLNPPKPEEVRELIRNGRPDPESV